MNNECPIIFLATRSRFFSLNYKHRGSPIPFSEENPFPIFPDPNNKNIKKPSEYTEAVNNWRTEVSQRFLKSAILPVPISLFYKRFKPDVLPRRIRLIKAAKIDAKTLPLSAENMLEFQQKILTGSNLEDSQKSGDEILYNENGEDNNFIELDVNKKPLPFKYHFRTNVFSNILVPAMPNPSFYDNFDDYNSALNEWLKITSEMMNMNKNYKMKSIEEIGNGLKLTKNTATSSATDNKERRTSISTLSPKIVPTKIKNEDKTQKIDQDFMNQIKNQTKTSSNIKGRAVFGIKNFESIGDKLKELLSSTLKKKKKKKKSSKNEENKFLKDAIEFGADSPIEKVKKIELKQHNHIKKKNKTMANISLDNIQPNDLETEENAMAASFSGLSPSTLSEPTTSLTSTSTNSSNSSSNKRNFKKFPLFLLNNESPNELASFMRHRKIVVNSLVTPESFGSFIKLCDENDRLLSEKFTMIFQTLFDDKKNRLNYLNALIGNNTPPKGNDNSNNSNNNVSKKNKSFFDDFKGVNFVLIKKFLYIVEKSGVLNDVPEVLFKLPLEKKDHQFSKMYEILIHSSLLYTLRSLFTFKKWNQPILLEKVSEVLRRHLYKLARHIKKRRDGIVENYKADIYGFSNSSNLSSSSKKCPLESLPRKRSFINSKESEIEFIPTILPTGNNATNAKTLLNQRNAAMRQTTKVNTLLSNNSSNSNSKNITFIDHRNVDNQQENQQTNLPQQQQQQQNRVSLDIPAVSISTNNEINYNNNISSDFISSNDGIKTNDVNDNISNNSNKTNANNSANSNSVLKNEKDLVINLADLNNVKDYETNQSLLDEDEYDHDISANINMLSLSFPQEFGGAKSAATDDTIYYILFLIISLPYPQLHFALFCPSPFDFFNSLSANFYNCSKFEKLKTAFMLSEAFWNLSPYFMDFNIQNLDSTMVLFVKRCLDIVMSRSMKHSSNKVDSSEDESDPSRLLYSRRQLTKHLKSFNAKIQTDNFTLCPLIAELFREVFNVIGSSSSNSGEAINSSMISSNNISNNANVMLNSSGCSSSSSLLTPQEKDNHISLNEGANISIQIRTSTNTLLPSVLNSNQPAQGQRSLAMMSEQWKSDATILATYFGSIVPLSTVTILPYLLRSINALFLSSRISFNDAFWGKFCGALSVGEKSAWILLQKIFRQGYVRVFPEFFQGVFPFVFQKRERFPLIFGYFTGVMRSANESSIQFAEHMFTGTADVHQQIRGIFARAIEMNPLASSSSSSSSSSQSKQYTAFDLHIITKIKRNYREIIKLLKTYDKKFVKFISLFPSEENCY